LGGGVDFHWLRFSVAHQESNQGLLSGRDVRFLNDRRTDTIALGLQGEWRKLQARANNIYENENSTRLKYQRLQFNQYLAYALPLGMTLSSSTAESFTKFSLPLNRNQENYSAHLSLDGFVHRIWVVRAYAGMRVLHDSQSVNETVHEAGITSRGNIGRLTMQGIINWSSYDRGPTTTNDWRLEVRIARSF
jgi:hypothetical protein